MKGISFITMCCTERVLNDSNSICFVYDLTSSANSPTAFVYND